MSGGAVVDSEHKAIRILFKLREALLCEKMRVCESADVVQWNAFSQLTSYAEQLHVELMNQIRDNQGVRNA